MRPPALAIFLLGLIPACANQPADMNTEVAIALPDAFALREGDIVTTSGVMVGRVTSITLAKPDSVVVRLRVSDSVRPHADATAQLGALDALGARYVAYHPGVASSPLPQGTVITAKPGLIPANPAPSGQ